VQTIDKKIISRIYGSRKGSVFTLTQFFDLGAAVRSTWLCMVWQWPGRFGD
jgi:hypothetical protein